MTAQPPLCPRPGWTAYKRHLRRGERCLICRAFVARQVAASRARKEAAR